MNVEMEHLDTNASLNATVNDSIHATRLPGNVFGHAQITHGDPGVSFVSTMITQVFNNKASFVSSISAPYVCLNIYIYILKTFLETVFVLLTFHSFQNDRVQFVAKMI